jgi:7,8-dihydroneopterin aldolase/epimerase/oxygenase
VLNVLFVFICDEFCWLGFDPLFAGSYGNLDREFPNDFDRRISSVPYFGFRIPRSSLAFGSPVRGFLPHSDRVDDQIQIKQLDVFTHIGVPEEERAAAQRLSFYLTLWPGRPMDEINDEIEEAVNYAAVCAEVQQFVAQRRDKLIETLANALALHLLEAFQIRRITVELRKYILPEVKFVSVTVTRERSSN